MASIGDVAADEKEIMLMRLLREAFSAFCTGSVRHWNAAFDASSEWMGEDDGTVLFARTLALARAIKSDRLGTFFFQPVHCGRVTDDETLILVLVQAARRNDVPMLSNVAERISQGGLPMRIQHAATRLGSLLDAIGPQPSQHESPAFAERSTTLH